MFVIMCSIICLMLCCPIILPLLRGATHWFSHVYLSPVVCASTYTCAYYSNHLTSMDCNHLLLIYNNYIYRACRFRCSSTSKWWFFRLIQLVVYNVYFQRDCVPSAATCYLGCCEPILLVCATTYMSNNPYFCCYCCGTTPWLACYAHLLLHYAVSGN